MNRVLPSFWKPIIFCALLSCGLGARCGAPPAKEYWVKLVCESADRIATIKFGPGGAVVEKTTETRILQSDISGPHGIAFSPDKKNFFVTIGHGRPYGTALKYETATDRVVKQVTLGLFPATADVTPDGNFLFAVNFNLHGDPVPSSVSVVDTNEMVEVARISTCIMPHGSRIARDGRHQYSACMMNDLLVEVDTENMKVSRSFRVSAGREQGFTGMPQEKTEHHEGVAMPMNMAEITCSPTWAQPSSDGSRVYVACNKSNEIVEVDAKEWKLVRRIPAGNGVYNLGVTSDGKLLLATTSETRLFPFMMPQVQRNSPACRPNAKWFTAWPFRRTICSPSSPWKASANSPGLSKSSTWKPKRSWRRLTLRHKPQALISGRWSSALAPSLKRRIGCHRIRFRLAKLNNPQARVNVVHVDEPLVGKRAPSEGKIRPEAKGISGPKMSNFASLVV